MNRELQEPWDVPPHPAHGDPDSVMTYAAKGRQYVHGSARSLRWAICLQSLSAKTGVTTKRLTYTGQRATSTSDSTGCARRKIDSSSFITASGLKVILTSYSKGWRAFSRGATKSRTALSSTAPTRAVKGLNIFCCRRTSRRKNSMQTHGPSSFTRLWLLRSLPTTFRH